MARRSKARRKFAQPEPFTVRAVVAKPASMALWAVCILVLATLAVYSNSFFGEFVYDDTTNIAGNSHIRSLWPVGQCQAPCNAPLTFWGQPNRPLLGFTFALNYALGGLEVLGYHVVNVAIHMTNALLLFGILRRTFVLPVLRERFGDNALALAFAIALLWAVHPLQTESVAYIVQRAESLVSLFYLLTLYCVTRGADSGNAKLWYAAAVGACLLGMSTKEVMATAPVIVLLYDRLFLAGSFREVLRRRLWLYVGLALTWVWIGHLVASSGSLVEMSSGGQGPRGRADRWTYAATQPGVILHYLRLSIWPNPLVFDYQWPAAKSVGEIVPAALAVGLLAMTAVWGMVGRRTWGFLGAWLFVILSPSSSIVPLFDDYVVEHRMYLPLAAVMTASVLAGYAGAKTCATRGWIPWQALPKLGLSALVTLAMALGASTFHRNQAYASPLLLWQDTAAKAPGNPRAQNNFGISLNEVGRTDEAIGRYREALRMKPDYANAHMNLATALVSDLKTALSVGGRTNEANEHYLEALRLDPRSGKAHNNYGYFLERLGRSEEAFGHYREALQLKPDYAGAHINMGNVFAGSGRMEEAIGKYREALRLDPASAEAHNNLGSALARIGRTAEAIETFRRALGLNPGYARAHMNLATALAEKAKTSEADSHYLEAFRLEPGSAEAHNNYGIFLERIGRTGEAFGHYSEALRLAPGYAEAHINMGNFLARSSRIDEAIVQYREALRLKPALPVAHNNLGAALARLGRTEEAIASYREALRLKPDYEDARSNLARLLRKAGQTE